MKQFSEAACQELWRIISDYMQRHGDARPGELAMSLLSSSLRLADAGCRLREDELPAGEPLAGGLADTQRPGWDGKPMSQEDIIREMIRAYQDDPAIVAQLEEFIARYL